MRNERLLTEVSEKRKGYGKCDNPSGSRPNFFGRQHLTFDKGGKFSARRGDSAENLIDGADGEQSPPSRLGIVSEL